MSHRKSFRTLLNLSMSDTFLIRSLNPPSNRRQQPHHAQYQILSRLSASFCKRWVHLDTVFRKTFGNIQEIEFSGSKMQIHVLLENAVPGEIGNRAITWTPEFFIILVCFLALAKTERYERVNWDGNFSGIHQNPYAYVSEWVWEWVWLRM